jgi:hypothetical protein
MPSPLQSFRAVRWLRTLNLVLQAFLVLTLFGGLNYLARNHPRMGAKISPTTPFLPLARDTVLP